VLKNWTLRLPWVFQFIGSEVYNIVDKMFSLPLLLKGYVWFRGLSLLLHGISGSRLRPILDRMQRVRLGGKADAAFGLRLLLSQHQPQRDTSKEGLFNRGVLLIPYESILRSMCPSEKALEVHASVERSESYTLGKSFVVAKLTASLSPRAKLRPPLLVTTRRLFRHPRSKSAPAKIS